MILAIWNKYTTLKSLPKHEINRATVVSKEKTFKPMRSLKLRVSLYTTGCAKQRDISEKAWSRLPQRLGTDTGEPYHVVVNELFP